MVMFSKFRRFHVTDSVGRRATLSDCAIALLDGDYPPLTHLYFQNENKNLMALPWQSIKTIDWKTSEIKVQDLQAAEPAPPESLDKVVMLGRDVLDALVLDLENRRATRANDLSLMEDDTGVLSLHAADTSLRAVLRRLRLSWLGGERASALYDWKYVEFLRGDPQSARSGAGYHLRITRLPPGEIANLSASLPYLHAAELLIILPDPIAADVLEATLPERQLQVFEELEEAQATRLIALMAPDTAADLLGRLGPERTGFFLDQLPPDKSEKIIELLRYPENAVGSIMTNDVVYVTAEQTVAEAREALRERLKNPDFIYLVYVVDNNEGKHLRGVVSLRELIIADDNYRVEQIMNPYVASLNALDPAEQGAYRLLTSHLAAMPVVNRQTELLGIVTVDAAVSRVAPSNWRTQAPRVFS